MEVLYDLFGADTEAHFRRVSRSEGTPLHKTCWGHSNASKKKLAPSSGDEGYEHRDNVGSDEDDRRGEQGERRTRNAKKVKKTRAQRLWDLDRECGIILDINDR